MLCLAIVVQAQSTGDRLFQQGKQLQATMTVASQNSAIGKFRAAKVAYTTSTKKSACDTEIAVCQSNIRRIQNPTPPKPIGGPKPGGKGGGTGNGIGSTYVRDDVIPELEVSEDSIVFEAETVSENAPVVKVQTLPVDPTWTFRQDSEVGWCDVERTDTTLTFRLKAQNTSSLARSFIVNVSYGTAKKTIKVMQKGKPFKLEVDKSQIIFGKDGFPVTNGGGKAGRLLNKVKNKVKETFSDKTGITIMITCDSEEYYTKDKNDKFKSNWYIKESWPEWLVVVRSEADEYVYHGIYVEAEKWSGSKPREGEIVICSQEQEVVVKVIQQAK